MEMFSGEKFQLKAINVAHTIEFGIHYTSFFFYKSVKSLEFT